MGFKNSDRRPFCFHTLDNSSCTLDETTSFTIHLGPLAFSHRPSDTPSRPCSNPWSIVVESAAESSNVMGPKLRYFLLSNAPTYYPFRLDNRFANGSKSRYRFPSARKFRFVPYVGMFHLPCPRRTPT